MTTASFASYKDVVIKSLLATGLSAHLAFDGWVAIAIMNRPTGKEVDGKIITQAPYNQDRKLILQTLNEMKDAAKGLANKADVNAKITRDIVEKNTHAIVKLQVVLETLQKERDHDRRSNQ